MVGITRSKVIIFHNGMSSFPLTFVFFKMVNTTNQHVFVPILGGFSSCKTS